MSSTSVMEKIRICGRCAGGYADAYNRGTYFIWKASFFWMVWSKRNHCDSFYKGTTCGERCDFGLYSARKLYRYSKKVIRFMKKTVISTNVKSLHFLRECVILKKQSTRLPCKNSVLFYGKVVFAVIRQGGGKTKFFRRTTQWA